MAARELVTLFLVLKTAADRGDFATAAEAQRQLRGAGVDVRYRPGAETRGRTLPK